MNFMPRVQIVNQSSKWEKFQNEPGNCVITIFPMKNQPQLLNVSGRARGWQKAHIKKQYAAMGVWSK